MLSQELELHSSDGGHRRVGTDLLNISTSSPITVSCTPVVAPVNLCIITDSEDNYASTGLFSWSTSSVVSTGPVDHCALLQHQTTTEVKASLVTPDRFLLVPPTRTVLTPGRSTYTDQAGLSSHQDNSCP